MNMKNVVGNFVTHTGTIHGGLAWKRGYILNRFLVSKETVVLRRWERSKEKFGFIKRIIGSDEGLTLETSAF